MKDERLPNIFDLEENKGLSVDEIMATDASDSAAEDKIINDERRKEKTKKAALISGGSILAIAVTAGFLIFNPFGGNTEFNKQNDTIISTEKASAGPTTVPDFKSGGDVKDAESFATDDKEFPIKLEDWEKIRESDQKNEDLKIELINKASGTEFGNSSNILPSEASGYTSDITKERLDDRTLNPMFSYWTAEIFQSETGEYLERLVNPKFGGWDIYQYSTYPGDKYFDIDLVSDMFTDSWRTSNLEKPFSEYVPVYADWAGNDFGMGDQLLASGSRWYGEIVNSNTVFTYNDEAQQYAVDLTAEVKYTAWSKDQTKLEKNGTLTLRLVPNIDKLNSSEHRVLIESANLKVDG